METINPTTLTAPGEPTRGPAILQPLRLRDFRLVFTGESRARQRPCAGG
jgi:hypothetical protein